MKRELGLATGLVVAISILTVADLPPFATVMDLGARAKEGWSVEGAEPPVPHAEIMTLERLAGVTQIPLDRVLGNLEQAGLEDATPRSTIAGLASAHGQTPETPMKALADRHGRTPHDLLQILAGA